MSASKPEPVPDDSFPLPAVVAGAIQPRDGFFREIIAAIPAAIYTTDRQGRITFYNEAAASLWGRRPVLGEDWWCGSWRLYWPDGSPMAHDECPMATTLKTGQAVRGAEAIAERPDGSRYAFVPYPTPLFGPGGELRGAVNMLVDITQHQHAQEATQRLAAIVASSEDAIISKALNGIVTSWNEAAERLFGYTPDEIIGRSILTLIPADRQGEEAEIVSRIRRGERVEHYETVRQRKDGSLFDISLTVSPIRRQDGTIIGASKIARDITGRKRGEERRRRQAHRLKTLNLVSRIVSRDLDLDRIIQSVTDIATELTGARFGAFFQNVTQDQESPSLYALSGTTRDLFEASAVVRDPALFSPVFADREAIRTGDARIDSRIGKTGTPGDPLAVASYLAVPVISSSGDVLGGLFFGHDAPDRFDAETEMLISAIAGQAAVAIDNARLHKAAQDEIQRRKLAEEAKELLLHEIKHRVKNTLATVQAIATQSFRNAPPDESGAFIARLHALADAHDLLTQQNWDIVDVRSVIDRALKAFVEAGRTRILASGPEMLVDSGNALLIAMILHELGTNAVKYGALSNDTGHVRLDWAPAVAGEQRWFKLQWLESGGPAVTPPTRKGFGSNMIERALRGQHGRVEFRYAAEGLTCNIEIALP
jgi:PAS domain S-box-containing protein